MPPDKRGQNTKTAYRGEFGAVPAGGLGVQKPFCNFSALPPPPLIGPQIKARFTTTILESVRTLLSISLRIH